MIGISSWQLGHLLSGPDVYHIALSHTSASYKALLTIDNIIVTV